VADEEVPDDRATVAAGYDALAGRFAAWAAAVSDPARDELFAELLRRLAPRARVLDVGCGSATTWTDLPAGVELFGIDISRAQVEAAERNVPTGTFLVADVTSIEFDEGSFDAATALYSIGHLRPADHEPVLARLARWLRPDGLLLASLPAREDPGSTVPWIDGVEMFFASLGSGRYEQILRDQGWRIIEARVVDAREPEGDASFFWILAEAPS
jgi:SAM-dependent methyltransferase